MDIWKTQSLNSTLVKALEVAAKFANDSIVQTPPGISNVTEWCKKDACWTGLQAKIGELETSFPSGFLNRLISHAEQETRMKDAKKNAED